jgi:hypothetical protein
MKYLPLVAAALCITAVAPATPSFSQSALTPQACQPLTSSNLDECCAAENWRELILPGEIAACPPLNADDRESGRLGRDLADTSPENPTTTGSIGANPGNADPVGGAGEKGMDTETPSTGTKGTSN